MVANKHSVALHEHLKQECQTLAELCVSTKLCICDMRLQPFYTGQGQTVDQSVDAQVSDLEHWCNHLIHGVVS